MAHARTDTMAVLINIRAKARHRGLIDQAAERQGRSRFNFRLEALCREAEVILLKQTFFTVASVPFAKLQDMLDHPIPPTDKLRQLL